ncbi:Antibiotic biosynthesis monooxygenase [Mycena venus]|uniref:Antibiotic biosynthesis monooxygenase n=1 Tax=Mycena venus TaxID=2733690 RepID=A0A8H6X8W8_9AGAR|nr:Antibiotic biosynthesis monooxygenase [Mycena venus]
MPSSEVSLALFVPLIAKSDRLEDVEGFLGKGYELVQDEEETIQWMAAKYDDHTPPTFMIFDTFRAESGRNAHLTGKIAEALMANADALLAAGPEIAKPTILANNIGDPSKIKAGGLRNGLRVLLQAKSDKVQAVKEFLTGALPLVEAEPETLAWYALEFPGTKQFAIIDFFADDAGRNAHLTGEVAKALFANAEELLSSPPDIKKITVVAANVKV